MDLKTIGWNQFFNDQFETGIMNGQPARVMTKHGQYYSVSNGIHQYQAELSGRFRYKAKKRSDFPTVGDFVLIRPIENTDQAVIYHLFDRKTAFVRKTPISGGRKIKDNRIIGGKTEEQVIASNIDIVFIVIGLDQNFNVGRLERYLILVQNSGAKPVIILNKADLCPHYEQYIQTVENLVREVPIHAISMKRKQNVAIFQQYMLPGQTIVFLGSSGVGKSSITNFLLNEEIQNTQEVSSHNGKGRHTTTHVEMWFHSSGVVIIDTPGLRELQIWCDEETLEQSFEDLIQLMSQCKFNNCSHQTEPGCAINKAIQEGHLDVGRYQRYLRLKAELGDLEERQIQYQKMNARRI